MDEKQYFCAMKKPLQLFLTFFRIGAFTLGGGYAMLSLVEKAVVDQKKWIPTDEFWDMIAVVQSLPGVFAVNTALPGHRPHAHPRPPGLHQPHRHLRQSGPFLRSGPLRRRSVPQGRVGVHLRSAGGRRPQRPRLEVRGSLRQEVSGSFLLNKSGVPITGDAAFHT